MDARRVVTGHREGKSVFVSDTAVAPITVGLMPGAEFHRLWGADATVSLPVAGGPQPDSAQYFPPVGGFRFALFTLPPATVAPAGDIDIPAAIAETGEKLPGLLDAMERGHPGMHTTNTVDFDIVLSGEVWLELDDGAEIQLRQGDSVVQNGTRHAWHNKSAEPCVLAVAIVGAERR